MLLIYLLMAAVGVLAMIFAVQNPDPVEVRFLRWSVTDLPLSLVILFSAMIGVICTAVGGFARQLRLKLKVRQLERQIAQLSDAPAKPAPETPRPDSGR